MSAVPVPTDQRSLSVGQCTNRGSGCAARGRFRFGGSLRCVGMVHLELLHLVEGDARERKAAVLLDDRQLRVRAHRCDHRADRKLRDLRLRLQASAAIRFDRSQTVGPVRKGKDGSARGRFLPLYRRSLCDR